MMYSLLLCSNALEYVSLIIKLGTLMTKCVLQYIEKYVLTNHVLCLIRVFDFCDVVGVVVNIVNALLLLCRKILA